MDITSHAAMATETAGETAWREGYCPSLDEPSVGQAEQPSGSIPLVSIPNESTAIRKRSETMWLRDGPEAVRAK